MRTALLRAETPTAQRITDGLEPKNWIVAVTLLVGWHTDRLAGMGWGLVEILFTAAIPVLFIKYGERHGHWGDRHVRRRQDRLIVIPGIMVSVGAGMALVIALGAPRDMTALIAAMLSALSVILAITTLWKVSVHTAVSSGGIAILAIVYGVWALLLYPLVAVVGWSRVALKDHTLAQVIIGSVLGATIASVTFVLLR